MSDTPELPPLPKPDRYLRDAFGYDFAPLFTADQMREFYAQGVLAEREAAHAAVAALIRHGDLGGNGCDQTAQNNGVIIAANLLAERVHKA